MRGLELRTKRLLLRPWRDADLEPLTAINAEPEVHEFLSRVPDREATAELITRARRSWEEHRFGFFALEPRSGPLAGELIGFCGVSHPTFIPAVAARTELGYRLARPAWGRGLATEAALACRDDAFYRAGLPELISLIDPANRRSQRVAEKVGMSPGESVLNPLTGTDVSVWSLRAQQSLGPLWGTKLLQRSGFSPRAIKHRKPGRSPTTPATSSTSSARPERTRGSEAS